MQSHYLRYYSSDTLGYTLYVLLCNTIGLFICGMSLINSIGAIEVFCSPSMPISIMAETGTPRINYDILDSLSTESVSTILREVKLNRMFKGDSINVALNIKPNDRAGLLLISALQLRAVEHGLSLKNSPDSIADFTMVIHKAGADYALLPTSSDSIIRTLSVQIRGWYKSELISHKPMIYADTVKRGSITYLEQIPGGKQFNPFVFGEVPPIPKTFWDDIVEPLVVVVALATTITLLFTVRSQ
jgi:hypothetical protein